MTKTRAAKTPKDPILSILPMRKGDGKIVCDFYRKFVAFHGHAKGKSTPAFFEKHCQGTNANFKTWIAFLDKKPVGFVITLDIVNLRDGHVNVLIKSLFVEEAFRGLGIGRCLIAVAARETLTLKRDNLRIEANKKNLKANALYKKIGFKPVKHKAITTNPFMADAKAMRKIAGKK